MTPRTRVLIVDDEPDIVTTYTHALSGDQFEVLQAYDGIAALDMAESEHPDIILLDIMMPMMSGYEVLNQLRSNPQTQRIPVICVTSAHGPEAREQCKNAGAQALLVKPFRTAELIAQVNRTLSRMQRAPES